MVIKKNALASLILRSGLAFVFFYAATTAFLHPINYYKYVPVFVSQFMNINTFLLLYGIFEIFLTVWLLSGKFVFYAALISAALLATLTIFNLSEINVLFRNVAIMTGALALATLDLDS